MQGSTKRVLAVALVAILVLAIAPAAAMAKPARSASGLRPTAILYPKDAYEVDDTSATAKVLPAESLHTFTDTNDEDWFKITADATGTPFVLETEFIFDGADTVLAVYDFTTTTTPIATNDDTPLFKGNNSSIFFSAPHPGTYYVRSTPYNFQAPNAFPTLGEYELFVSKGIARRLAGATRYETAARVSKTMYSMSPCGWYGSSTSRGVVLVNGFSYADALAGGAWAAMQRSGTKEPFPVLLTGTTSLPAATAEEIERLAFSQWQDSNLFTVTVVGGPSVVATSVIDQVKGLLGVSKVDRIAGDTRYGTAAAVASATAGSPGLSDTVFIVNGYAWPDALSANPLAGKKHAPLLFSQPATIGAESGQWLKDHAGVTKAVIVGSESVISSAVASALATTPYSLDVTRVAGVNRYETSRKLAVFGIANYGLGTGGMILATGENFADGLAAGPLAMSTTTTTTVPLLLTPPASLSSEVTTFYANFVKSTNTRTSYVVGGAPALSASTFNAFTELYK